MKIIISDVQSSPEQEYIVKFTTSFGSGRGTWKSKILPQKEETYYVEFEVEKPLVWGTSIVKCNTLEYSIAEVQKGIILQGKIESIDENNCIVIRIGDSLLFIETIGDAQNVGSFVKLIIDELSIYDTNL